jgi:hypothetical protein
MKNTAVPDEPGISRQHVLDVAQLSDILLAARTLTQLIADLAV